MRRTALLLLLALGCGYDAAAAEHNPPPADLVWVKVTGGTFDMGAAKSEFCRREPLGTRTVAVEAFEIQAHEVTQAQFESNMGYNPSFASTCDGCPVDSVSWHEAAAFANAIAHKTSTTPCYTCVGAYENVRCAPRDTVCDGPRLPTEAEWEYAARAGTLQATYAGRITSCMSSDEVADQIAWYKANSSGRPRQVGRKKANPWGLYDVLGNIAEWTGNVDADGFATLRGGSWYHNAERARAAGRLRAPPDRALSYAGIRLVRPVTTPSGEP